MNRKRHEELAAEADRLASEAPSNGIEFDKWSPHLNGLLSAIKDAEGISGWLKERLSPRQIGDLLSICEKLSYNPLNVLSEPKKGQMVGALRELGTILRSSDPVADRLTFISFSHADQELGAALKEALSAAGVVPFFSPDAKDGLPGGKGFFENITKALQESGGLVSLLTPESNSGSWIAFETGAVLVAGHPALAVLVGMDFDDLTGPLRHIQHVSINESNAKLEAKVAEAAGKSPEEIWTPRARERLNAFISLARSADLKYRTGKRASKVDPSQKESRIAGLLNSIPEGKRQRICTIHRGFGGGQLEQRTNLDLLEVRQEENAAVFMVSQFQPKGYVRLMEGEQIHIPLDQIETVSSQPGGGWSMTVKGKFDIRKLGGTFTVNHIAAGS